MSKTVPKRIVVMPGAAQDREIHRAAMDDPNALPLSVAQLNAMVPLLIRQVKV